MRARTLVKGAAAAACLLGATPASAEEPFGPTVDPNTGSAPTYQRVLLPQVSPGRYDEVANSQLPYDGFSPLVLTRGRLFLDPGSLAPQRAFLFTATQVGSTVKIADRAPIGPLGPGYNQFPVTGVTLEPGQFLGYGIGTDATVGRLYIGGYKAPGFSGVSILDTPGNLASETASGSIPNYAIALQVFGDPPGSGGGGGSSGSDAFSLALGRRTAVGDVSFPVTTQAPAFVTFDGEWPFKDSAFELRSKTFDLTPGQTTVRLRWERNATSVRRITRLLEKSAKARRKRAVITADVTYVDGATESFTARTKLRR